MYYNEEQQLLAQSWKENLSNKFEDPVVTEIVPREIHLQVTTKIITQNQSGLLFICYPAKVKKTRLE